MSTLGAKTTPEPEQISVRENKSLDRPVPVLAEELNFILQWALCFGGEENNDGERS